MPRKCVFCQSIRALSVTNMMHTIPPPPLARPTRGHHRLLPSWIRPWGGWARRRRNGSDRQGSHRQQRVVPPRRVSHAQADMPRRRLPRRATARRGGGGHVAGGGGARGAPRSPNGSKGRGRNLQNYYIHQPPFAIYTIHSSHKTQFSTKFATMYFTN